MKAAPGDTRGRLLLAGCCYSIVITVELSTGVSQVAEQQPMRAWVNGDHLVVEHHFGDKYPVQLELLNEAGQLHQQMRVVGPPGRLTVPATGLASGIWCVRVGNDQVRKTLPVVVVR